MIFYSKTGELIMLGLKDAIRRMYAGDDALIKHMFIFVLTGVSIMLSESLNTISKTTHLSMAQALAMLGALIGIVLVSIYMGGYSYQMMHNSHDENKLVVMPDFTPECFKIFFKALPLVIVWCSMYGGVLLAIWIFSLSACIFLNTPQKLFYLYTLIITTVFSIIVMLVIPFIFAKFTKNYERKGLYNPIRPFKYACGAFKDFIMLILKLLPIFIAISIIGYLGKGDDIVAYLLTGIWAYLHTMLQYAANFCYVQIYKKHFDEE